MERRKFLLGAGSASLGGSALLGTGAFSRVESHRGVTVQVAEDPDAYLGLDGCRDDDGEKKPNASFTSLDEHGHLQIEMGKSGYGGYGVNSNSITSLDDVFQIRNQGKEQVCVDLEYDPIGIEEDKGGFEEGDPAVVFYVSDPFDARESGSSELTEEFVFEPGEIDIEDSTSAVGLEVGESICVGIQTRTFGIDATEDDLTLLEDDKVRIVADVDGECTGIPPEEVNGEDDEDLFDADDISFVAFIAENDTLSLDNVEALEFKDEDGLAGDPVTVEFKGANPELEEIVINIGGPDREVAGLVFGNGEDGIVTTRDDEDVPENYTIVEDTVELVAGQSDDARSTQDPRAPDDRDDFEFVKYDWNSTTREFEKD